MRTVAVDGYISVVPMLNDKISTTRPSSLSILGPKVLNILTTLISVLYCDDNRKIKFQRIFPFS